MAHSNHTIHQLNADDLEAMRKLNQLFSVAFEEPETYEANPPSDDYLRQRLLDASFIALVASDSNETLVGGLVAYELKKFESERSEIYVYDLAVRLPSRRQGIATALLESLRHIATTRGAWVIFIQADLGDDPAINLYTKLGTREDVVHFDLLPA